MNFQYSFVSVCSFFFSSFISSLVLFLLVCHSLSPLSLSVSDFSIELIKFDFFSILFDDCARFQQLIHFPVDRANICLISDLISGTCPMTRIDCLTLMIEAIKNIWFFFSLYFIFFRMTRFYLYFQLMIVTFNCRECRIINKSSRRHEMAYRLFVDRFIWCNRGLIDFFFFRFFFAYFSLKNVLIEIQTMISQMNGIGGAH